MVDSMYMYLNLRKVKRSQMCLNPLFISTNTFKLQVLDSQKFCEYISLYVYHYIGIQGKRFEDIVFFIKQY